MRFFRLKKKIRVVVVKSSGAPDLRERLLIEKVSGAVSLADSDGDIDFKVLDIGQLTAGRNLFIGFRIMSLTKYFGADAIPAIFINGQVKSAARVPEVEEIVEMILDFRDK